MKRNLFLLSLLFAFNVLSAQVGINTTVPTTTLDIVGLSPATKVEGILIPRFTGDEIFSMPISGTTTNESNLVYATSAATNQTGVGVNLTGKGFYFWDGAKWVSMVNLTTISNSYSAFVKPMNIMLNDGHNYLPGINAIIAPGGGALIRFDATYSTALGDIIVKSDPLNFIMWDYTNKLIKVPQQLLGYTITVNLSLKYNQVNSNSESSRFVAFTGNAVVNLSDGTYTGGTKIKDIMFTTTKTSTSDAGYVRDELILSPILVTQEIIDYGIALYLGSGSNQPLYFYEPILVIDYGVVNTTLP